MSPLSLSFNDNIEVRRVVAGFGVGLVGEGLRFVGELQVEQRCELAAEREAEFGAAGGAGAGKLCLVP